MPAMTSAETIAALQRAQVRYGHEMRGDGPTAPSRVVRWTCGHCGLAIVRYQGNTYGSALDTPCAAVTPTTNGS